MKKNKLLSGELISLRPATPGDRWKIYQWLSDSGLSKFMFGPPLFGDNPPPTWKEFVNDYTLHFFDGSKPFHGRCFIILAAGQETGQVNYNDIIPDEHATELDIWMASSSFTGKGYGPDALTTLCRFLRAEYGIKKFFIAPSKRNENAVKAYKKAGFMETMDRPAWLIPDYKDITPMMKTLE